MKGRYAALMLLLVGALCGGAGSAWPQVAAVTPAVDEAAIKSFIQRINDTVIPQDGSPPSDPKKLLALLEDGRLLVSSSQGIALFRQNDSVPTIEKLTRIAATNDRGIRLTSSLILVNVVDNRTVCAVLDKLWDRQINDDARFNLWQTVRVASQATTYAENVKWIEGTAKETRSFMIDKKAYQKTLDLVTQIEGNLAKMDKDIADRKLNPKAEDACRQLPNIRKIER